jgi:hypothetical protein
MKTGADISSGKQELKMHVAGSIDFEFGTVLNRQGLSLPCKTEREDLDGSALPLVVITDKQTGCDGKIKISER